MYYCARIELKDIFGSLSLSRIPSIQPSCLLNAHSTLLCVISIECRFKRFNSLTTLKYLDTV